MPVDALLSYLKDKSADGCLEYHENYPLAPVSSFKIGGNADLAIYPNSTEQLISVVCELRKLNVRYVVIGNATNVLFADAGYRGAVVFTTKLRGISIDGNLITADCGVPLITLSVFAQKHGLDGLAFAYGIPGTVGGAVYMNAGAYEGEMKQVVSTVTFCDPSTGEIKTRSGNENEFGYRHSYYSDKDLIILSTTIDLKKAESPEAVKALMDEHMKARNAKQPLEYPSAGSTFKRYPGYYTAKLIEEAGLKGYSIGGAKVSEKHAGFVINTGGASAADVLALIDHIKAEIFRLVGINIECEVRYIE